MSRRVANPGYLLTESVIRIIMCEGIHNGDGRRGLERGIGTVQTVGETLRDHRERTLRITAREAAEQLGVRPGTYSRWENEIDVPWDRVNELAEWCGMSTRAFGERVMASAQARAEAKARRRQ